HRRRRDRRDRAPADRRPRGGRRMTADTTPADALRASGTDADIVIVAAARTPQGRLNGQLSSLTAPQLGAAAIAGALERGGVPAAAIDAVIMGQVLPAGSGQNAARQAAIAAGIG